MDLTVRTIGASDIQAWARCMGVGFLFTVADGYPEYLLGDLDFERTFCHIAATWAALRVGSRARVTLVVACHSPTVVMPSTRTGWAISNAAASSEGVPFELGRRPSVTARPVRSR